MMIVDFFQFSAFRIFDGCERRKTWWVSLQCLHLWTEVSESVIIKTFPLAKYFPPFSLWCLAELLLFSTFYLSLVFVVCSQLMFLKQQNFSPTIWPTRWEQKKPKVAISTPLTWSCRNAFLLNNLSRICCHAMSWYDPVMGCQRWS